MTLMQDPFTLFTHWQTELYTHMTSGVSQRETFYRRGTPLLNSPYDQLHSGWILKKGIAREYHYDEHGDEVVTGFWSDEDIIIQQAAVYAETLPVHQIELIRNSHLVPFTFQELNMFLWSGAGPDFLRDLIVVDMIRQYLYKSILQLPAKKALQKLGEMYPVKYIPKKDLVSFLGISPSTLFRIFPD